MSESNESISPRLSSAKHKDGKEKPSKSSKHDKEKEKDKKEKKDKGKDKEEKKELKRELTLQESNEIEILRMKLESLQGKYEDLLAAKASGGVSDDERRIQLAKESLQRQIEEFKEEKAKFEIQKEKVRNLALATKEQEAKLRAYADELAKQKAQLAPSSGGGSPSPRLPPDAEAAIQKAMNDLKEQKRRLEEQQREFQEEVANANARQTAHFEKQKKDYEAQLMKMQEEINRKQQESFKQQKAQLEAQIEAYKEERMEQVRQAWTKLEEEYERIEADRRDIIAQNETLREQVKILMQRGGGQDNEALKKEFNEWKKGKMADVEAARRALAAERQAFEVEKRELMNELERLRALERVGGGASSEDKEALIEEIAAFEKLKKEFLEEAKVLEDRAKRNALANETEKQLIAATRIQLDKERAMIEEERAALEAEKAILAKEKLTKGGDESLSSEKVKQIKAVLVAEREKLDKEKEAFEKRIEEAQKALKEERIQFEVQRAEKERQFALLQKRLREEKEQFDEERSLAEVIISTLRQKLTEERERNTALQKALEESQDELHKRIEDENKKRLEDEERIRLEIDTRWKRMESLRKRLEKEENEKLKKLQAEQKKIAERLEKIKSMESDRKAKEKKLHELRHEAELEEKRLKEIEEERKRAEENLKKEEELAREEEQKRLEEEAKWKAKVAQYQEEAKKAKDQRAKQAEERKRREEEKKRKEEERKKRREAKSSNKEENLMSPRLDDDEESLLESSDTKTEESRRRKQARLHRVQTIRDFSASGSEDLEGSQDGRRIVRRKSRTLVRNTSADTPREMDAGSSEDDSESQTLQAPISRALESLQNAASDLYRRKIQRTKKKIARVGKKPKKTALNALMPLYFGGKKFNYRLPIEMTHGGWLLARYNKCGSYVLLDPDNPTPDGVHTVQHPGIVRQIAVHIPYVISYHTGDKGDTLVYYNTQSKKMTTHELWSEDDPKRPSKVLLFCNETRIVIVTPIAIHVLPYLTFGKKETLRELPIKGIVRAPQQKLSKLVGDRLLLAEYNVFQFWDLTTYKKLAEGKSLSEKSQQNTFLMTDCESEVVATAEYNVIRIWNIVAGFSEVVEIPLKAPASSMLIHENYLLVADFDMRIAMYGLISGSLFNQICPGVADVMEDPVDGRDKRKTLRELFLKKISDLKLDGELLFASSTTGMAAFLLRESDQTDPILMFHDESPSRSIQIAEKSLHCLVEDVPSTDESETNAKKKESDDEEPANEKELFLLSWPRKVYTGKKMQMTISGRKNTMKPALSDVDWGDDESSQQSSSSSRTNK